MIGLTKKNMPDFYFRGTLAQYWKAIYAEYQRLFLLYGREPFEFTSPNPKTSPLAEYAPNYYDFVEILFWEAEHRDFIVRVKANSVLDSDLVELYVNIYVDPLKMYGESNLSTWKAVENSLEEQGLLIRPTAQFQPKKKRGMQEGTKNKIKLLREIRLEDLEYSGSVRSRKSAMDEVHITDKTWRKYDLKTYDNWGIKSYKPGKYPKTE